MYGNLKKKYGQNFLIDDNVLRKINKLISSEKLKILEIGPGDGRLTDHIINTRPSKFTIIEIDSDLINYLKKKYENIKFIKIINNDILNQKINEKYDLIISNLPYNISSQILVKFSVMKKLPEKLIFMFQKEFAERLIDKKLNSINSLVNCFYDVKFNFNVGKNCFRPIPKIDSSVLTLTKKTKPLLKNEEIEDFIDFKRKLFSHKRKTLRNILKDFDINEKFDLSLRVENLIITDLIKIFREINV